MAEYPTFQPATGVAERQIETNANLFDRVRQRKIEAIKLQQQSQVLEQNLATGRANLQEANIRMGALQKQLDQSEKINDLRISGMAAESQERQRVYDLRSEWNTAGMAGFSQDIANLQSRPMIEQQKLLPEIQLKYAKFAELNDAAETMGGALNRAGGLAMAQFAKTMENSNVEQAVRVSQAELQGQVGESDEDVDARWGAVARTPMRDATGKVRLVVDPNRVDPRREASASMVLDAAEADAASLGVGADGRPAKIDFKALLADPEIAAIRRVPTSATAQRLRRLMTEARRAPVQRPKSAQTIEAESASQELAVVSKDLRKMFDDAVTLDKIKGRIGVVDNSLAKLGNVVGISRDPDVVKFEQRFASVRNVILKARSGGAVTESEAARFLEEMGSFNENDDNFVVRFQTFLGDLERTIKSKLEAFGAKDASAADAMRNPGVTEISTDAL
jgi:hypothetical protein